MATVQPTQPPRGLVGRFLGWARPNYPQETSLGQDEWRSQHDEISKTIWGLASLLVACCLFCLITLGAPDSVLVNRDAKISIPFAGTQVSYTGFLLFGPLVLVVLALYLHVFIEQRLRIGLLKGHSLSPFLFNLGGPAADLLSAFLFYWMLPCVLIFFCLRALPRPEAPLIVFLTVAVTGFLTALGIRRYSAGNPLGLLRGVNLVGLWAIFILSLVLLFLTAPIAWNTLVENQSSRRDAGQSRVVIAGDTSSPVLPRRRLQLFGASLEKTNLSGLYAAQADMRKADLREADLEGANLSGADLREADLTKANLAGADLSSAKLQGAKLSDAVLRLSDLHGVVTDNRTEIDVKWKRVLCIVNGKRAIDCPAKPIWAWANLRDADLRRSDLAGADLTGADLEGSDLSDANLDGAILRLADLRGANLPRSHNNAVAEGALTQGAMTAGMPGTPEAFSRTISNRVVMLVVNHATGSCLEAPDQPTNQGRVTTSKTSPCNADRPERRDEWIVKRFPAGYLEFTSVLPLHGGHTSMACLDGTPATDNLTPIQVYECSTNPDEAFDNQQWRISLAESFVRISKRNAPAGQAFLDSGGNAGSAIHFWTWVDGSHNQDWTLTAAKTSP